MSAKALVAVHTASYDAGQDIAPAALVDAAPVVVASVSIQLLRLLERGGGHMSSLSKASNSCATHKRPRRSPYCPTSLRRHELDSATGWAAIRPSFSEYIIASTRCERSRDGVVFSSLPSQANNVSLSIFL